MSCASIDRGSFGDCDNLPTPGTAARLILINYDDVLKIYYSDDGVITDIVLKPTKVAYEFLGFNQDVRKAEGVVKTNLKNRFTHSVDFVVYEVTQEQKNNLRKMAKGRFMAIVELSGKHDYSIELLGKEVGLKMSSGQIKNAHENGGVYKITLSTPDNGVEFERKLPQVIGTGYANAIDIIDDLLDATVECENAITDEFGNPLVDEFGNCITFETGVDEFRLLEDGFTRLLEDGFKRLLE